MYYERKAYKRIAPNFEALLTDAARERFRAIVATTDADWYTTANVIFGMGLDAWEQARAAVVAEDSAAQAAQEVKE